MAIQPPQTIAKYICEIQGLLKFRLSMCRRDMLKSVTDTTYQQLRPLTSSFENGHESTFFLAFEGRHEQRFPCLETLGQIYLELQQKYTAGADENRSLTICAKND